MVGPGICYGSEYSLSGAVTRRLFSCLDSQVPVKRKSSGIVGHITCYYSSTLSFDCEEVGFPGSECGSITSCECVSLVIRYVSSCGKRVGASDVIIISDDDGIVCVDGIVASSDDGIGLSGYFIVVSSKDSRSKGGGFNSILISSPNKYLLGRDLIVDSSDDCTLTGSTVGRVSAPTQNRNITVILSNAFLLFGIGD